MHVARLYDSPSRGREPVTVRRMLNIAKREPQQFTKGSPEEVQAAVTECRKSLQQLKVPLRSIEVRRNEYLAHLDENTVINPGELKRTAPLTLADLEQIFDATERILLKMDRFCSGLVGNISYLGQDDYKTVFRIIADARGLALNS
jgi:AbiU2